LSFETKALHRSLSAARSARLAATSTNGLSRSRSDARRYPAIDPLDSWSKYVGIIDPEKVTRMNRILRRGDEIRQMMTVVGEEGTPTEDFTIMLKAEFFDSAYLQQNAFDDVDAATSVDRQRFAFDKILEIAETDFAFDDKDEARHTLQKIGSMFLNWNYARWDESVVPESDREDEPIDKSTIKEDEETERGDFKEILGQIDKYVQSLLDKAKKSQEEDEVEEVTA
jgi:vacuolar-type H+-ATPase catalytic subunit A/Vma1